MRAPRIPAIIGPERVEVGGGSAGDIYSAKVVHRNRLSLHHAVFLDLPSVEEVQPEPPTLLGKNGGKEMSKFGAN